MSKTLNLEIPAPLCDLLFTPSRYKVAHGGRGGAKSWGFARALLILGYKTPLRILCAREYQNSIQESVHKLLSDQIDALGLASFYLVQQAAIRGANGTEFIFSGIKSNVTKIKSTEGIDIAWVEEAEKVSNESWDILIPTIRKPGSEIWISFNPNLKTDPTSQRFIENPPPSARVVKIGWQDNPWFPAELKAEKDYLYSIDKEAADHIWGGEYKQNSDAQVLKGKCHVEAFSPMEGWSGPYFGADWGFATDPSTFVKLWINDATLYVEHEAYAVGVEIEDTPELFDRVPGGKEYVSRADNARPEMISYMQRHGYHAMYPAQKWPGSVEDGVTFLRSFRRIVIHPRCTHTADESRLWAYKVDKLTGDVLPELVDKHNHCWDAIRYALEPITKNSGCGLLDFYASTATDKDAQ